jgi:hypothetical protein
LLICGVKNVSSVLYNSLKRQEPTRLSQSQSPSSLCADINTTAWAARSSTCEANERRRGQRPGATTKFLRRTPSGATGFGLGTTIKYLRGAAGNRLGTTIKYLSGAAGIGLGTTMKHLRRSTSGAAVNDLGTTAKYLRGAAGSGLGTTINYL